MLKVSYFDRPAVRCPSSINNWHLLLNHWANLNRTSQELSFGGANWKLFKELDLRRTLVAMANKTKTKEKKLKKSSCHKPLGRFLYNLAEMFLWWFFIKIVQAIMIRRKIWTPEGLGGRGGGDGPRRLLSLYIYTENFKNIPVRNYRADFNITWQKCSFGDHLPR